MSQTTTSPSRRGAVRFGIAVLAIVSLATAAFQTIDPSGFVDEIGPFGAPNGHYVRDVATWYAAYGAGLLAAFSAPSWRVPVLGIGVVQGVLHLINHIVDMGDADPASAGVVDAVLLAGSLGVTVWLYTAARRGGAAR